MENLLANETNNNQAIETTNYFTQNQVNGRDLLCLIFGIITPTMRKNMMVVQEYVHDNVVPALDNIRHGLAEFNIKIRPIIDTIQQFLDQLYAEIKPLFDNMQQFIDRFHTEIEPTLKTMMVCMAELYTNPNICNQGKNDDTNPIYTIERGGSLFIIEDPVTEADTVQNYVPERHRLHLLQSLKEHPVIALTSTITVEAWLYSLFIDPWHLPFSLVIVTTIIIGAAILDYRP